MRIERLVRMLIAVLAIVASSGALAQKNPDPGAPRSASAEQPGWLGVWVQPLTDELKAQLAPLLTHDQGLLVARVEPDSPAEQAGVQQFDVLLTFDGQKLFNPAQFSSLVQSTRPESRVELGVIHQGVRKTLNPTLMQRGPRVLARTHRPLYPRPPMPLYPPPSAPLPMDDASVWDKFDTVEVKTLSNGRYRAVVSFKDKNDEIRTFTFEGEKQEIVQQIEQLPELPGDKKRALLRALNLQPGKLFGFDRRGRGRDFTKLPRFNRSLFDHPFFYDPFFRDPFYAYPWSRDSGYPPWQLHLYPQYPPKQPRR